jgi:hypothetical protein
MKRLPSAALAFALSVAATAPAIAQEVRVVPPPDLFNPKVEFEYVRPRNTDFMPIYERLKARKVLETLRQFLAPLKFKDGQTLIVKFDECGAPYRRHKGTGEATVCYEFVDQIDRLAPTAPIQLTQTLGRGPVRPDAARVGPVVQALIHEVAIATFGLLDIPVWGRQENAADRVAGFVMLRFSKYDLAWNTIVGTAWFLAGGALAPPDLSDVRGVTAQRYYTTLCIAYGGDRKTFRSFVAAERPWDQTPAAGDLPLVRARGCAEEFTTLRDGFNAAVMPHLDQALLKRVQDIRWIVFND